MNTYRKTAVLVGVFYIVGTVAGILSVVFTGSILDDATYLSEISAKDHQFVVGALLILTMGLALAMVSVVIYPLLRQHNEPLAVGYVVFRGALETATYIASVIVLLLLLTLSREFVKASAPVESAFQPLGTTLLEAGDWISYLTSIVFSLSALMLCTVLYQTQLVPRWLSVWGLIGAVLYLAQPLLALFGSVVEILFVPLAIQEMVLAVWLIVKGFNPSAIAPRSTPVG